MPKQPLYDEEAKFNLRLPGRLYEKISAVAHRQRLSMNQWIVQVLEQAVKASEAPDSDETESTHSC